MYSMSNFKLLVEKQAEIDTIYQRCDDLIEKTVTPQLDEKVEQFLKMVEQHLTKQGFKVTNTSTGVIANYQEAVINVDKHSKHLEECFLSI